MNSKNLNLGHYSIPQDAEILVFLISEELKIQRVFTALSQIGCDDCYLRSNLNKLVLAHAGFDDPSEDTYDFYFRLLERYDKKMEANYDSIIKQALHVYGDLMLEKKRLGGDS